MQLNTHADKVKWPGLIERLLEVSSQVSFVYLRMNHGDFPSVTRRRHKIIGGLLNYLV